MQPPRCAIPSRIVRVFTPVSGGKIKGQLRVFNDGGGLLRIESVRTSCGCTVASVEPQTLAPGQEALISLIGNGPPVGEKRVDIMIATNDPEQPTQRAVFVMTSTRPIPHVFDAPQTLNWNPTGPSDCLRFIVILL